MKLFLNASGLLDYDGAAADATVSDLLHAVDEYLEAHPLPCAACAQSCCRKPWAVEADNVFVKSMAGGGSEAAGRFVREKLALKLNHSLEFNQYVLVKQAGCPYIRGDNLCSAYEKRPLICRLYVCTPRSRRYDMLRGAVAAAYLQALVAEERLRRGAPARKLRGSLENPALGAEDYSLALRDILSYAGRSGWLEPEDLLEL